ncbi:MAG: hypothetical protein AAGK02_17000 [Pseudomonadota bacterium]
MSKDLVFIASGGRTGTTFMGERLIEVIDGCYSQHEPDVLVKNWEKSSGRIKDFGVWHMLFGRLLGITGLRVIGHKFMAGQLDLAAAAKRIKAQREHWYATIEEPLIVESSGRNWMLAPVLQEAFPDSRLVGIIRDPRDWVESWRRHQPRRHTKFFEGWFPQGPLTPAQVKDTDWADKWDDMGQFGRLVWDWRIITRELSRAGAKSENIRVYRFEDLFSSGQNGKIAELVDFVAFDGKYKVGSLDGFTGSVRNASSGKRVKWQDWTPEQVRLMDGMCGELMRQYGYGSEPEWIAKLDEAGITAEAA